MPHSLQAKKRVRQNETRNLLNRAHRSRVRTLIAKFNAAVEARNQEVAEWGLRDAVKAIDKAAQRGIIHKNTAARRKASLQRALNRLRASAT